MAIVLFTGFLMSIFLGILLIGKKNKLQSDKFLFCIFVVYAITIGGTYIDEYNLQNNYSLHHLLNVSWLFLFLHGPLFWFYTKYLTDVNMKLKYIHLLHFAPFVIYSVFHYFNFISLPATEKIALFNSHATRLTPKIGTLLISLSIVLYYIVILYLIKKHRENIKNKYSYIESIDLNWLKTFVISSLVIFSLNILLFNLNNYFHFTEDHKLSLIAFSFSTGFIFYIGYFGIKQGRIFADTQIVDTEQPIQISNKDKANSIEKKDYSDIIQRLILLMEQQQPHLDPELNLAKLSSLMKTKPELISEILNSSLNQNFFDFINKYRIEEFKLKCLSDESKNLSVIGIAYDCGFNSKAAFYRAFNKFEGISPTVYIAMVSLKK
jgi:AraC-like DNA-binding protein